MPANGRWDLIRRLKVKGTTRLTLEMSVFCPQEVFYVFHLIYKRQRLFRDFKLPQRL